MSLLQLIYRLVSLLLTPITITAALVYPIMPRSLAIRITFLRDVVISMTSLVIGRLLPTLTVPTVNLRGKTAIVTGANSGIGLQIATDLARNGATVFLACRNLSKARDAIIQIHQRVPESAGRVKAMELDTSKFESTRAFSETWTNLPDDQKRIDILCHNAGIAASPGGKDFTEDGLEVIYATNLLGSFALTHFLEPHLSDTARVVFTSSTGQYTGRGFSKDFAEGPLRCVVEPGFHCPMTKVPAVNGKIVTYSAEARYGHTKAMQCALARCLQRRWDRQMYAKLEGNEKGALSTNMGNDSLGLRARGRMAHAFTPGFTFTPIFEKFEVRSWRQDLIFAGLKATLALATDVEQGAATGSWLACTQEEKVAGLGNGGGYWDRMERRLSSADTFSDQLLERLWIRWENDAGITWK